MASGCGLAGAAAYIPPHRMTVEEVAAELGMSETETHLYRHTFGLDQVAVATAESLDAMLTAAMRHLLRTTGTEPARVGTLLYCHTLQIQAPPLYGLLARVIRGAGLTRAQCCSVSQQNCTSFFMALRLARNLLKRRPQAGPVVILTGDRAYSAEMRSIPNTTLMCDAAAACLVTDAPEGDRLLSVVNLVDGAFYKGMNCTREECRRFELSYLLRLRQVMESALAQAGLTWQELDLVLPHNVNISTWQRLSAMVGYQLERVFTENIGRLGHAYCSDGLINYLDAVQAGRLQQGQTALLVGVGLGATYGACVIRH